MSNETPNDEYQTQFSVTPDVTRSERSIKKARELADKEAARRQKELEAAVKKNEKKVLNRKLDEHAKNEGLT